MRRPAVVLVATLCLSILHLSAHTTPAVAPLQAPDADAVRDRLHAYLLEYQPKLSELIADEQFVQQDVPEREGRPGSETFGKRTLRSEVAFIALPGGAGWLGFRRVKQIDNTEVSDGPGSLRDLLSTGAKDDYTRARGMLADSARFNLGEPRTINLPNLPLEMLHPRHGKRFAVRVAGQESIRGARTTRLVFVESFSPTIIRATDGGDVRSIVTAWIEPATGRLWRADVVTRDTRAKAAPFDSTVSVRFGLNGPLGLLVPEAMHEVFFAGQGRRAWGDATYTNYRRFQTSARIVPQ